MIILFHGAGGHGVVNGKNSEKLKLIFLNQKENKNNLIFNFFKKKSKKKLFGQLTIFCITF